VKLSVLISTIGVMLEQHSRLELLQCVDRVSAIEKLPLLDRDVTDREAIWLTIFAARLLLGYDPFATVPNHRP